MKYLDLKIVKYTHTTFFCCTKLITLYLNADESYLTLYHDKEYKNIFLRINTSDIVAIGKRQIDRHDVYKFSIFYRNVSNKNKLTNEVTELKLKATTRRQTDNWIEKLRCLVYPERYKFNLAKGEIQVNDVIKGVYANPHSFYIKLSHLEYFFIYRAKVRLLNCLKEKSNTSSPFVKSENVSLNYPLDKQSNRTSSEDERDKSEGYSGVSSIFL